MLYDSLVSSGFYDNKYYSPTERETFIKKDVAIITAAMKKRAKFTNMEEGDFLRFKDGSLMRVTILEGNSMQFYHCGSFRLFNSGGCSFSGTCGESLPIDDFAPTNETALGSAWIFSQGRCVAHNGVYFQAPFKVWEQITGDYSPKKDANDHLFSVNILEGKEDIQRYGGTYFVTERNKCGQCFKDLQAFEQWANEEKLMKTKDGWGTSFFMGKIDYLTE